MNFWEYNKTIALKVSTLLLCVLLMTTSSCKKDLSIYEINEVHVSNSNIDKNGLKKDIEFVSQAYSDLFEKPISVVRSKKQS
ncbi:MAG TPA: hypothetical protein PKM16_09140 [Bacteroidia bacterium]|nr:hypothetical protein [Bacteroidia bacterium]